MGLYVKIERSVAIESLDAVDVTLWSLRTPSKEMLPSISQHNTSIFHSKLTCCIIVIGSAANIEFNPLIIFHSSFKTQRKKKQKKVKLKMMIIHWKNTKKNVCCCCFLCDGRTYFSDYVFEQMDILMGETFRKDTNIYSSNGSCLQVFHECVTLCDSLGLCMKCSFE